MKTWLIILSLLVFASPVLAQERMAHPETGEDGAWIPRYMQIDHLKLEVDLEACQKENKNQTQRLDIQKEEVEYIRHALDEEKQATKDITTALIFSEQALAIEKKKNQTKTTWLWITGGGATAIAVALVVALVVLPK